MGYRPITYCTECDEPFDEYTAPEDRICECCQEVSIKNRYRPTREPQPKDTPND